MGTKTLLRSLCMFAIGASLVAGAQAEEPKMRSFIFEMADFGYPTLTDVQARALIPELVSKAKVTAHYRSFKARKKLVLTSCMSGVACLPDPHLETFQVIKDDRSVTKPVQLIASEVGKVAFDLPMTHKGIALHSVSFQLPLDALWAVPSVKAIVQQHLIHSAGSHLEPQTPADSHVTISINIDRDMNVMWQFCERGLTIHMPRANHYYAGLISLRVSESLPTGEVVVLQQPDCSKPYNDSDGRISSERRANDADRLKRMNQY